MTTEQRKQAWQVRPAIRFPTVSCVLACTLLLAGCSAKQGETPSPWAVTFLGAGKDDPNAIGVGDIVGGFAGQKLERKYDLQRQKMAQEARMRELAATRPRMENTVEVPYEGTLGALDAKNGFRDLTFGTGVTADMKPFLSDNDPDVTSFTRPTDDLRIGYGRAIMILYRFFRGQLEMVWIFSQGEADSWAIRNALEDAFGYVMSTDAMWLTKGMPIDHNKGTDISLWEGKRVVLIYEEDKATHNATITFSSVELQRELLAHKKAKALGF